MPIGESLLEFAAAASTADLRDLPDSFHRAIDILDHKSCLSFNNDFRDRTARKTDHWRTTGRRFNHDQPERLRSIDRKQESGGAAEQFVAISQPDEVIAEMKPVQLQ